MRWDLDSINLAKAMAKAIYLIQDQRLNSGVWRAEVMWCVCKVRLVTASLDRRSSGAG
jgi:hypothetical protein